MSQDKHLRLESRIPLLVEPLKKLNEGLKEGEVSSKDYMTVENFTNADFGIEIGIVSGDIQYFGDSMFSSLSDLKEISEKYPDIKIALKGYTSRLMKFARKRQELKKTYEAFKEVFGGNE